MPLHIRLAKRIGRGVLVLIALVVTVSVALVFWFARMRVLARQTERPRRWQEVFPVAWIPCLTAEGTIGRRLAGPPSTGRRRRRPRPIQLRKGPRVAATYSRSRLPKASRRNPVSERSMIPIGGTQVHGQSCAEDVGCWCRRRGRGHQAQPVAAASGGTPWSRPWGTMWVCFDRARVVRFIRRRWFGPN